MHRMPDPKNVLRLRKKHGEGRKVDITAADGARLVRAQSLGKALIASAIAIILFCVAWVSLTSLTNRVFPWITVVLGAGVGLLVRRAGKGVDWRFPALAADDCRGVWHWHVANLACGYINDLAGVL